MIFDAYSRSQILRKIEHEFGCDFDFGATHLGVLAEHLRASTALATTTQRKGVFPAPTIRITTPVRNRLESFWPETHRINGNSQNVVLGELKRLQSLGDLIEVSDKKSLIGPLKFLEIDESCSLLLGGGSLQMLPSEIRSHVQIVGRVRILNINVPRPFELKIIYQRLEDWLEIPHDEMSIWARNFIKHFSRAAEPVSNFNEVFLFVLQKWVSINDFIGSEGWYLSRRTIKEYGNLRYEWGISKVNNRNTGLAYVVSVSKITSDDGRRLQGSFRIDKSNQPLIYYQIMGPVICVSLPHPLPSPERKLMNLGWRVLNTEDPNRWPRLYFFSKRLEKLLSRGFQLQGYKFVEKSTGTTHVAK